MKLKNYKKFLNENLESDAIGYNIGKFIYHVTSSQYLDAIKEYGIIPQKGVSISG